MNAWGDLPNSRHIDWVLESVKSHPELWDAALDEIPDQSWAVSYYKLRDVTRAMPYYKSSGGDKRYAAWFATRTEVLKMAGDPTWYAARHAARGTILALVIHDDCDQYLEMTSDELKTWALMTEHPMAVLLIPMVVVREKIAELETV